MLRRLVLICALSFMPAAAMAQSAEDMPSLTKTMAMPAPSVPKPLKDQMSRGAQVYYMGKYDVLDGWVMIRTGQPEFYYSTPGGNALVMGILFDGDGNVKTGDQVNELEQAKRDGLASMLPQPAPQANATPTPAQTATPSAPVTSATAPAVPEPAPATPGVTAQAQTPAPLPAPTPAPVQAPVQAPAQAPVQATNPTAAIDPVFGIAPIQQPAPKALGDVANTYEVSTPANRLFADARAANNVVWGKADAPPFFAFVDPNCPHCQQFLREVAPYVAANKVSVHMILVGYDDRSRRQAAFAMAAADGPQRMLAYAQGDASKLSEPADINVDAINANTKLLRDWNLMATPMIIYRSGLEGPVRLIRGRPLDIGGAVADLLGQPAVKP